MLIKVAGQTTLRDGVSSGVDTPAANTAAVITLAAVANRKRWLHNVQWSYSGDPTGGRLTVSTGGTPRVDVDIITGGPGGFSLEIVGGVNENMVITLAAGGAGVTGKLNVQYTTETNAVEYVG